MRVTALVMVALIASMSGSLAVTSEPNDADITKMSEELISELSSEGHIEAIVQFYLQPNEGVWNLVSSTGVDVLAQTSVLHGALVRGTSTELSELSSLSMVKHMEANVLIEHFYLPGNQNDTESMMHETVNWVNASLAWHRAIIDTNGVLKTEPDMSLSEYDGEGATAVDLDTGIDGEHPDFDCGEPWTGEKLIWSAKWTGVAWIDAPNCNSDTSSGHGTHVGGVQHKRAD